MSPEAAAFLDKARESLGKADGMLDAWPDEAGRAAYLAALSAARALIVQTTVRVVKSHRGVQSELARLTKDDPRLDPELRAFLGRTYKLKVIADYEPRPGSEVTREEAAEAIETARRFVAKMVELIG